MRLVTFRYDVDALTLRYFRRTAGAALSGEYPRVDLRDYPAELHINLAEAARGLGLGRKLMQACLDQMTELGIPGIHLKTTTMNAAAIKLYEKMGFEAPGPQAHASLGRVAARGGDRESGVRQTLGTCSGERVAWSETALRPDRCVAPRYTLHAPRRYACRTKPSSGND